MKNNNKVDRNFFKFTTDRPVAILMVVIGVFVFGLISYQQLPLNLMPDMTYPSLTVRTEYPGTAPEEIETTISKPIEQALGIVDNLVAISSVSKAEQSDVILEFTWDTDMNKATADLREKIDQVYLPEEVKRPIILRYDPSLDPIMRLGLYGDAGLTFLRYLGEEEIKRALETVDGIAAVKVKGGLEEEIRVELNEQKMALIGIDIQSVKNRLAEENVNLAGGNLKEGETEYLVRTLNEFVAVKEIDEVVVGNYNGVEIKIKDIGRIYRTSKEREIITRIGGRESIEIEIYKEADANIVAVAQNTKERLYGTPEQQAFVKRLKAKKEKDAGRQPQNKQRKRQEARRLKQMTNFLTYDLPEGVHIETLSDQSIFIKNSIDEVKNTAVIGGILAIIVLFVFLRKLGPTIIIGLSIPISIIATFAPMKIFDVSLNIMSLGGLALGIGMLVDNSIVVLESIARCREEGDSLIAATIRGVSEVGGAVMASTLTTIAVFFPIVFIEGVAGQVFGDMALTVVFSLLASLAVALFLIPMLSSRQIAAFTKGTDASFIPSKYILAIPTIAKIDHIFDSGSTIRGIERMKLAIIYLLQTLGSWLARSLLTFLAFVMIAAKQIFLAFCNLLLLALSVVMLPFKNRNYGNRIATLASGNFNFTSLFNDKIWHNFFVCQSTTIFIKDITNYKVKYHQKGWFWKIAGFGVYLVFIIYVLIKYLFLMLMELIFRGLHSLIILIGLFFYMGFLLARIVLYAPAKLIIFLFDLFYSVAEKWYPKILKSALDRKYSVVGFMLVIFAFVIIVIAPKLGSELIPEVHQGEFYLELSYPVGTPVEKTDQRTMPIQEAISRLPLVQKVASVSGTDKTAASDSDQGEHTAKLTITLKPTKNIAKTEEKTIEEIRKLMLNYSGIKANISRPTLFSFKTPIEVYIKGFDLKKLQELSRELEERMSEIPGLVDVKSNIQRGNPEIQIYYDRRMLSHYGLNILNVASIVRNKVRGDVATEFKEEDRRIDILVRLREADKESINDLRRLIINPQGEIPIPLQAVADIKINEGPSEIRREGQQRAAVIKASTAAGVNLSEVNQLIFSELQKMDIPVDFNYEMAGQNKEMETSLNGLMMALALAIFLVYIVMASQFESMIHPFVIIFTIPLAIVGVVLFLWALNIPLSIVVFLGLIMLAGIVVNNAIVLVDYMNQLRENGIRKMDAIIQAGKVRLRPILMTTATTVLGLLPMAVGLGDGAEIRMPMAITVIIGLITSTALTLVVIPTVYAIISGSDKPKESF
jgi:HAE1 family hydrophobic/amphiphilic exporter-1